MPTVTLNADFVRDAVCLEGRGKTDYYDTAITGFILEARSSGGKTYHLRYKDAHGKQRQHKIGDVNALTFDKARQMAERTRAKVLTGENPTEDRKAKRKIPTLQEFVQDIYLPHIRVHRRNIASTVGFIDTHILPQFGKLHLDQITSPMIVMAHRAMLEEKYAPATANKLPTILKTMYNLAAKLRVYGASDNPAQGVALVPLNNEVERYLTEEETERLYAAAERSANPQLKHIVPLMLMCGFRKRELLDAKWEDIDMERRNWRIPLSKSGKPRNIPISDHVLEELKKLRRWHGCPWVVPSPNTKKPYANLYLPWDTCRKRAGLPDLRMHDLRHSFASNLVNAGQSIYVVSKLLGHASLKNTQRYAHLADTTLHAAVNLAGEVAHNAGRAGKQASVNG